MTKDEAIEKAIDFLDGSYKAHAVRKALQEALEHPASWRRLSKKKLEKIYGDSSKINWYAYEAIDQALQKLNHF